MVVVSGDDNHEMSSCVVAETKWHSQMYGNVAKSSPGQYYSKASQLHPDMQELLVIVGDKSHYDAQLTDHLVDLPIFLRFGPNSTIRQIKYAIASSLEDNPAIDSFRIYISQNSSPDALELFGDNKTINDFDFTLNELVKYKILITRIRKEDQIENPTVCINDIYLHLQIRLPKMLAAEKYVEKTLLVNGNTLVRHLIENIHEEIVYKGYTEENIVLHINDIVITTSDSDKTIKDMGFDVSESYFIKLNLHDHDSYLKDQSREGVNIADDDTMELQASWASSDHRHRRSQTTDDWVHTTDKKMSLAEILLVPDEDYGPRESPEIETKSEPVYVGLINQAMTCYLNSLIQALYMTPEFRNALYNWEYVDGSANGIPYQLQRLFLNLQTSKKSAVETTSLTKSFGWDSTEAWQQHDIQELCRVMFDALEQKFKNTQQADLINQLYEGKMIDYVKCLECGTEKSREDKFLDIPLPVKPFGSAVAYNSVEEALRAFVQPETLDGVNQYFCETCNKKCDAHKGLKFTKFPYILTLHLKRFDFDYNTFHRIKLNDKVTFPDILNLSSLIPSSMDNQESPSTEEDAGTGIKCDDSSTTDSGHLDECLPCDNGLGPSDNTTSNNEQDDDEGIYISNCASTSSIHSQENERNRSNRDDSNFYKYELFSIMIHSGSASGGHYYAYIKDFKTQEWLCFNDQNVSQITYDDIQKTYGGGPSRAFYSGAYSTSTNAYMLMYRQIHYERNCLPMQVEDFPKHIQTLLKQMKEQEEKKNHERTRHMYKIHVYFHHPIEKILCTDKIFSVHEDLLSEITEKVYSRFKLDRIVSLDQCRLVSYDVTHDVIECSYDGRENVTIGSIIQSSRSYQNKRVKALDMLLETRKKDKKFEIYHPGEISTTVFVADVVARKIVNGPFIVRVPRTMSVTDYKKTLSEWIGFYPQQIRLGDTIVNDLRRTDPFQYQLEVEGFHNGCKVFVETRLDVDVTKPICERTPMSLLNLYEHVVMLRLQTTDISPEIMKEWNIPAWESRQIDKDTDKPISTTKLSNSHSKTDRNDVELTNLKADDEPIGENEEWQEQSNSEDSSLSDSDRTLVGEASEDEDFAALSIEVQDPYAHRGNRNKDNDNLAEDFFKVGEKYGDPIERMKIYVHAYISRNTLKKRLEPILKVPIKYFKVVRHIIERHETNDVDLTTPTESFSDGETLNIKLCRAIRDGDFTMKLYFLRLKPKAAMSHDYLCEFIVFRSSTVAQIKRDLVVELKKNHSIDIPYERLRLRKKDLEMPATILLDDMTIDTFMKIDRHLEDINSGAFFVQRLPAEEPVTDLNQIVLFAWRYFLTTDEWAEELEEIVLQKRSIMEVKTKLSNISGIPVDNVTFTKGRWPHDSAYERHYRRECVNKWLQYSDCEWSTSCDTVGIIFYRDSTEDDSTDSSKVEFETMTRRQRVSRARFHDPSWSPRRERALKIFVDDK